jgi:hypothetical protein
MSKFSDSTFYLAPSGYRETILFPQKPLSSIGHLSVGRASSATRTNAAGQVEDVCYNLIRYSEDFSNVAWGKTGSTVTTDLTTAPDNNLTADKIIESATTDSHFVQAATINFTGAVYTMSIYAKASERNILQLFFNGSVNVNAYANFDLTNGVVGGTGFGTAASITSVGNGWYRCIMTATVVSGALIPAAYYCLQTSTTATRAATYAGNGTSGLFIWGAQLVQGNLPKDYLYTSDRLNFPRVDFSDGSASLLLEPQRTNLLYNSGWTGGGTTPTNWGAFITGTTTAVTSIKNNSVSAYRFSGTLQRSFFIYSIPVTSGVTYAISVYVESVTTTGDVGFMLSFANITGSVTYFRNGVSVTGSTLVESGYTYTMLFVSSATASADIRIGMGVQGNATTDYVLSMPQMEVGAYSTSFILTPTASTATRLADTFTRNNIYTNNLISSSGGTWFVELKNSVIRTRDMFALIGIGDTVLLDTNSLVLFPSTRFSIAKYVSGTPTPLTGTSTDTAKVLFKWNGSTADIFVNGTKVISATAFTATNLQFIATASIGVPIFITQMALWNTPLSDSQCIEITGVAYTTPAQAYGSLNLVSESPDCLYTSVNTINRI